ncbi:hypothetical protein BMS3Bbin11_00485 [bacterium BMS3Bbin11]|nr:hypothetical protein BMS3Bbin11_00485 [bacterium BMS3Bbin11]
MSPDNSVLTNIIARTVGANSFAQKSLIWQLCPNEFGPTIVFLSVAGGERWTVLTYL